VSDAEPQNPGREPIRLHRLGEGDPTAAVNVRYRPTTTAKTPTETPEGWLGPRYLRAGARSPVALRWACSSSNPGWWGPEREGSRPGERGRGVVHRGRPTYRPPLTARPPPRPRPEPAAGPPGYRSRARR
jgi:hypothetical protein